MLTLLATQKGVATIGPTLDIIGQIKGSITLDGEVKAGARLNFGKAEVYYPEASSEEYTELDDLLSETKRPERNQLEPIFEAGVKANADLRVLVEPVVNLGLVVGSDRFGGTIMDAHISGFVNTTLLFTAVAGAKYTLDGGETGWYYGYGVYFLYNVGYRTCSPSTSIRTLTDHNPHRCPSRRRAEGNPQLEQQFPLRLQRTDEFQHRTHDQV